MKNVEKAISTIEKKVRNQQICSTPSLKEK